jgi:hypothetical protein
MNRVFTGTEIKVNVSIEPIDGLSMQDYDFEVYFFCSPVYKQVITKEQAKMVDKDNYLCLVDTRVVGVGNLKCMVIAHLPDADFDGDHQRGRATA